MPRKRKCLHCEIKSLVEKDFPNIAGKELLLRLCEVAGDYLDDLDMKTRADAFAFWGEAMTEIMRDIQEGTYK